LWLMFKLLVSIPVLSSALIGYDKAKLNILEIALRITCVVLMFVPDGYWDLIGLLGAVLILLAHRKVLGFNSLMKEGGAL